jgi:hypothetical protein
MGSAHASSTTSCRPNAKSTGPRANVGCPTCPHGEDHSLGVGVRVVWQHCGWVPQPARSVVHIEVSPGHVLPAPATTLGLGLRLGLGLGSVWYAHTLSDPTYAGFTTKAVHRDPLSMIQTNAADPKGRCVCGGGGAPVANARQQVIAPPAPKANSKQATRHLHVVRKVNPWPISWSRDKVLPRGRTGWGREPIRLCCRRPPFGCTGPPGPHGLRVGVGVSGTGHSRPARTHPQCCQLAVGCRERGGPNGGGARPASAVGLRWRATPSKSTTYQQPIGGASERVLLTERCG